MASSHAGPTLRQSAMPFVISGLDPSQFSKLQPSALVQRRVVDESPGFPCRVTLEDAAVGEEVLLVHFEHLTHDSPYRSAGPIFVRPHASRRACAPGEVPLALQRRLLSVRGYDQRGMMLEADVVDGSALAAKLEALFREAAIDFVHVHHAKPGCFACRVDRVSA